MSVKPLSYGLRVEQVGGGSGCQGTNCFIRQNLRQGLRHGLPPPGSFLGTPQSYAERASGGDTSYSTRAPPLASEWVHGMVTVGSDLQFEGSRWLVGKGKWGFRELGWGLLR